MDVTQTTDPRTSSLESPQLVELVVSLGREARCLALPVLCSAVVSLGAAALSWLFGFSSYFFDSFRSFLVCVAILGFSLAPGVFLLWLHSLLRDLALLPSYLRSNAKVDEELGPAPDVQEGDQPVSNDWIRRVRARLDTVLELWEHLIDSKEDLLRLGGPSRSVRFLAQPVSIYIVAAALLISALLLLTAAFSGLVGLVSFIF